MTGYVDLRYTLPLLRVSLALLCVLQRIEEEETMTPEQLAVKNVGKLVRLQAHIYTGQLGISYYFLFVIIVGWRGVGKVALQLLTV